MGVELLVGADIVPTKSNKQFFINGDMEQIIDNELLNVLKSVDYRIFNLETPLSDVESPIEKCGPNLIATTTTINGIKKLGVDFLTLANNHILDHGIAGLETTKSILDKAGIAYSGVGDNLKDASKAYIFKLNGYEIGIYCCAENEFSIATKRTAGVNPFDPLESLDYIVALKESADFVIVLYHGGKEHYRYPSPNLQKVCRKIVDKGADLVVCQHSHCIGCKEDFNNGTIVYGQGNFLFDASENELWQTSLLIKIIFNDGKTDIEYIPIIKNKNGVKLADFSQKNEILKKFHERSNNILDEEFVENEYSLFSEKYLNMYLRNGVPYENSLPLRVLNKLSNSKWFIKHLDRHHKLAILNSIECEAHRELFIQGLKNSIKNTK